MSLGVCLAVLLSACTGPASPAVARPLARAPIDLSSADASPWDAPAGSAREAVAAPEPRELGEATRLDLHAKPAQPAVEPAASEVFSSFYGPGLYGRGTACGLILTTVLLGVAHRSLPCGTPVTLQYGSAALTVPVVDRGPYVLSREFDLTYATKVALGCPDLCRVAWLR